MTQREREREAERNEESSLGTTFFRQERSVPYGAGYLQHRSERLKSVSSSSESCYLCAIRMRADATLMEEISSTELPLDEKFQN